MINFIIGFLFGSISLYLFLISIKLLKQKRGIRYKEYSALPLLIKLKDSLRHIVYEYGIKRDNHDFLLNVIYNRKVIVQVMHRAHFPYLCTKNDKITFGLALYIPIAKLDESQKEELEKIIVEEIDNYQREIEPFDYYVMDLGKSIRHGGYLITRILREVFKFELDKSAFDLELFSEGELPYFGKKHGFLISSN